MGRTPVFLYGFDDLTAVQLDAVATLVEAGAEVVVSLPFEEGRDDVYRARAGTLHALAGLAGEWLEAAAGVLRRRRWTTWSARCSARRRGAGSGAGAGAAGGRG